MQAEHWLYCDDKLSTGLPLTGHRMHSVFPNPWLATTDFTHRSMWAGDGREGEWAGDGREGSGRCFIGCYV